MEKDLLEARALGVQVFAWMCRGAPFLTLLMLTNSMLCGYQLAVFSLSSPDELKLVLLLVGAYPAALFCCLDSAMAASPCAAHVHWAP